MALNRYRVYSSWTTYGYAEVEAESEDDAQTIAENMGFEEWDGSGENSEVYIDEVIFDEEIEPDKDKWEKHVQRVKNAS